MVEGWAAGGERECVREKAGKIGSGGRRADCVRGVFGGGPMGLSSPTPLMAKVTRETSTRAQSKRFQRSLKYLPRAGGGGGGKKPTPAIVTGTGPLEAWQVVVMLLLLVVMGILTV